MRGALSEGAIMCTRQCPLHAMQALQLALSACHVRVVQFWGLIVQLYPLCVCALNKRLGCCCFGAVHDVAAWLLP